MSNGSGNGGSKFAFFLAGVGIGAIVALLLAPGSGDETRQMLGQKANAGRDYVTNKSKEFRQQAEGMVDKAKDLVAQQKEQLSAALEAGKQAYQEERSKPR
ncbi:MAG: YtxH domain-containing protein [Terriglobia bacterium]